MNARNDVVITTTAGAFKADAKNVELKAKMNAKMNSSVATEVSSSLNTTIKGMLVKIN